MTEKTYGGITPHTIEDAPSAKNQTEAFSQKQKRENPEDEPSNLDIGKLKQAGEISKKVKLFAREIIKPGVSLLEIANKIDAKIEELGGKPAFPINLSINEIAAHSTPAFNDTEKAHGLLKVDIGVHVDGYVADTAFSLDLENSEENKKLIEAAELALKSAIDKTQFNSELKEIGKAIEDAIKSLGFQPIINLSGHSINQYDLHAGVTIPNYDNNQTYKLKEGTYAIEPFATSGHGKVRDGKLSGIYHLENDVQVRDSFAREVLAYIKEEFSTLPFCSRWLVKKFGSRALIALKRLEEAHILHQYAQLVEIDRKPVAQAEHTIILTKSEKIVTT
ncbi:MAG: type II methionyl aminopeptidase [Nanoarchaeota archaeon]|nr:type II methionyl aminopeptidase [Nanoarchaeota archaeon]MBU0977702.1 type II methionyl aminopeptidase [Nanoarchaeota archaeon]